MAAMAPSSPQPTAPKRPGPSPIFTERLVVNVRPDQRRSLDHIAGVCEVTVSDLLRWWVDEGITAFESQPVFKTLPRRDP